MSLQPRYRRILRLTAKLLMALGVGLAIFFSSQYISSTTASAATAPTTFVGNADDSWIAYSVDYETDKARGEKTVEHYGEEMRPIVQQAIKNNEENPDSKSTADNSYKRESPLNELLPERLGKDFSTTDLLEMRDTEDPKDR